MSAAAIAAGARSLAAAIASVHTANRMEVPGWIIEQPSISELAEIRFFVLARSTPEQAHEPYLLPQACDTYVSVVEGSATIGETNGDTQLLSLNESFFAARGKHWAVIANQHPTTLLCVSYREVQRERNAGEHQQRSAL